MHKLLLAVALSCAATPVLAEDFPEAAVKAQCAEDWPGDYFMQNGCLDMQRESWASFPLSVAGLPDDIGSGILDRCKADWPGDYFMQNGCAMMQVESWRSLNN